MNTQVTIFVSHVAEDEAIALAVKRYLEGIFLNASVFVSGRDLSGGQVWVDELRRKLKNATAVVALISGRSVTSAWVHFEAGAGFIERRTIPLLVRGVSIRDVGPPLTLLHVRTLDKRGLQALAQDIARLAGMRSPSRYPVLKQTLTAVDEFLKVREVCGSDQDEEDDQSDEEESPDPRLQVIEDHLESRARRLVIQAIKRHRVPFDIPADQQLRNMDLLDLHELAEAVGAATPSEILSLGDGDLPSADGPEWKKVNARKRLDEIRQSLDEFETELGRRRPANRRLQPSTNEPPRLKSSR